MRVKILHERAVLREAINDLLTSEKGSRRVRIMCSDVRDTQINSRKLFKILANLLAHGVEVVIIIGMGSKPEKLENRHFYEKLIDRGALIHHNRRLHVKTILLESRGKKDVIIMSANITPTALYENYEMGVLLTDVEDYIYTEVSSYFNKILKLSSTGAAI